MAAGGGALLPDADAALERPLGRSTNLVYLTYGPPEEFFP